MSVPGAADSKRLWRAWAAGRRAALVTPALSARVVAALEAWPGFRGANAVLSYLPFGSEIDIGGLHFGHGAGSAPGAPLGSESSSARGAGRGGEGSPPLESRGPGARVPKTFFVTRTPSRPGAPLTLHRLDPTALEAHPYGFLQPAVDASPADPAGIELVLVPGLAFDRSGFRLGYGRGYFDRLLPQLPASAPRVGVTILELIVPALPAEPHDIPMTHLATELGVREVAPAA